MINFALVNPFYDSIKTHPRFGSLLKSLNLG
jgi:hypothetical protein